MRHLSGNVTLYPSPDVPVGGAVVNYQDATGAHQTTVQPNTPFTVTADVAEALLEAEIFNAAGEAYPVARLVPSIEAYGHSWVAGYAASSASKDYLHRLSRMLGGATVNAVAQQGAYAAANNASGGVGALLQRAPATTLTAGPYVTKGGLKLASIGFNDYSVYGSDGANGTTMVEKAMTLAYSRLLAARVVNALKAGPALNNTELTFTGAWSAAADTTISSGLGFASTTTSGNSVTLTTDAAYAGEAITVILPGTNAHASTATITADGGGSLASYNTLPAATLLGSHGGVGASYGLRIPAGTLSAGAHSVTVTFTGITAAAIFGGFIIEGNQPPPLLLPTLATLYANPGGSFNAGVAWQDARVAAIVGGFPSAKQVSLQNAVAPAGNSGDDENWSVSLPGHLTDLGYRKAADCLYAVAQRLITQPVAARMA